MTGKYLLYRHFMEMGRDFVETVWNLLIRICEAEAVKKGSFSFEDMVEVARLYSGEIEYSDENTDAIMNELE